MAGTGCGSRLWAFEGVRRLSRGFYSVMGHSANVEDLFSLLAMEAIIDWAYVDPDKIGSFRTVASKSLVNSRLGSGEDFVEFNS